MSLEQEIHNLTAELRGLRELLAAQAGKAIAAAEPLMVDQPAPKPVKKPEPKIEGVKAEVIVTDTPAPQPEKKEVAKAAARVAATPAPEPAVESASEEVASEEKDPFALWLASPAPKDSIAALQEGTRAVLLSLDKATAMGKVIPRALATCNVKRVGELSPDQFPTYVQALRVQWEAFHG